MPVNSHIKPLGWKEDIHNQATSNKTVCFLLFKVFFKKKKKRIIPLQAVKCLNNV